MLSTGPQQIGPSPWIALSEYFKLNAARVSSPTMVAMERMSSRSKVADQPTLAGKEVAQPPDGVQLESIAELRNNGSG